MTQGVLAQFGAEKLAAAAPLQAPGRRRRPEGRRAAVRQRRRQAHHRADPGRRRRRVVGARRVSGDGHAAAFPRRIPFVEHLGFELWGFGGGRGRGAAGPAPRPTSTSWDVAHGGVLMTLLDVAMAHAARSSGVRSGTRRGAAAGCRRHGPGVVTDRDEDQLHAPGRRPAACRRQAAAPHRHAGLLRRQRLRRSRPPVRPRHRHLQVPACAARRGAPRQAAATGSAIHRQGKPHDQPPHRAGLAPRRRGHARQLPPREPSNCPRSRTARCWCATTG